MSTFLGVLLCVVGFVGWAAMLIWTILTVEEAADGETAWPVAIAWSVATLVVTAAAITAIHNAIDEQCPPGTTREYHATGDRTGYHYCERSAR